MGRSERWQPRAAATQDPAKVRKGVRKGVSGGTFDLRRWKFEHWFARAFHGETAHTMPCRSNGDYLDPRARLAWRAWCEAVDTVTEIPPDWELRVDADSPLAYRFKWRYGIETAGELAHRLAHEPRLFEMAMRDGYVRVRHETGGDEHPRAPDSGAEEKSPFDGRR